MPQRICPALMLLFLAGFPTVFAADESTNKDGDWKLSVRDKDVEIYSRPHPGSSLREVKAVGPIDASSRAVCAVIDDLQNYTKFMPCTIECRVIRRGGDSIVGYKQLSQKICAA